MCISKPRTLFTSTTSTIVELLYVYDPREMNMVMFFAVQLSIAHLADCCFKQNSLDGGPSSSAPSHSSRRVRRVHQLNTEGDALAVTRLRAFQGEFIYGR